MGVHGKLAEIVGRVEYIKNSGQNDFHKYKYTTETDLLDAVRPIMSELGLVFYPSGIEIVDGSSTGTLLTARCTYRLVDSETEEFLEVMVLSQGTDSGDKSAFKLMTGARKYALRQLILVSTGDDPEKDDDSLDNRVKNSNAIMVIRKFQIVGFLPQGRVDNSPGFSSIEDVVGKSLFDIEDNKKGTEILKKLWEFASKFTEDMDRDEVEELLSETIGDNRY
jgi:hypothetical protein